MERYFEAFINEFLGISNWVGSMIVFQEVWYKNYFYGLLVISLLIWGLEVAFPWRKKQAIIRKDFWMDGFYMYFNFFVFNIIIYGVYGILEVLFSDLGIQMYSITLFNLSELPIWLSLFLFFILNDFVQWFTHVLLHRYKFLWRFHRVHHSVEEMGFAAHLRYHWMENLFYKPLKTLIVMLLGGFQPEMAFTVHFFSILIGHLNHANVRITWGPLKYIFNNSVMHLYHHAKDLPQEKSSGVNFGISLSIWDYLFKTNYIPQDQDGSYELGFEGVSQFPKHFFKQLVSGFRYNK